MKYIFKKFIILPTFLFIIIILFFSNSQKAEATVVTTNVKARVYGIAATAVSPLTVTGTKSIEIIATPTATATSCTLSSPTNSNIQTKTQTFLAYNSYNFSPISVAKTTTYAVTCEYTTPITYSWQTGVWDVCTSSGAGICSGSWTEPSGAGTCNYSYESTGCDQTNFGGNCNSSSSNKKTSTPSLSACSSLISNACDSNANTTFNSSNNESSAYCYSLNEDTAGTTEIGNTFTSFTPSTPPVTNYCSGPTTSSACTSQNAACSFYNSGGSQSRTVSCVSSV